MSRSRLGTLFQREEFPQDSIPRTITSIGPLFRASRKNAEAKWRVTLTHGSGSECRNTTIESPSGYIADLRIGSVWKAGFMNRPMGNRQQTPIINVDCSQQAIWYRKVRGDNEGSSIRFVADRRGGLNEPPYVIMPMQLYQGCTWAAIRCSELFRAFFGANVPLGRYAFDFTPEGGNPYLFDSSRTGIDREGVFHFRHTGTMTAEEAAFVAKMVFMEPTRRALCQLSASARVAAVQGTDIWPTMLAPMDEMQPWKVFGSARSGLFQDKSGRQERRQFFAITQLLATEFEFEGPPMAIESPEAKKREGGPSTSSGPRHTIRTARTSDLPPMLRSSVAPGNTAQKRRHLFEMDDMFPGLRFGKITNIKKTEEHSARQEPIWDQSEVQISQFSGLVGGSGDENVGRYTIAANEAKELRDPQRSPTKSLMTLPQVPLMKFCTTEEKNVPNKFKSFIPALHASELQPHLRNASIKLAARSYLEFPYKSLDLLLVPAEWGSKGKSAQSPNGYRRVLWVDISVPTGRVALLDVEGKHEEESVGAQIYVFPKDMKDHVEIDLISQLIHSKVIGNGWPNADDYFEGFHSIALNHVCKKTTDVSEIMADRVTRKMEYAISCLAAA